MPLEDQDDWPTFDALLRDVLPSDVDERLRPQSSGSPSAPSTAAEGGLGDQSNSRKTPVLTSAAAAVSAATAESAETSDSTAVNASPKATSPSKSTDTESSKIAIDVDLPAPLPPLEIDTARVKALLDPSFDDHESLSVDALTEREELEPLPEIPAAFTAQTLLEEKQERLALEEERLAREEQERIEREEQERLAREEQERQAQEEQERLEQERAALEEERAALEEQERLAREEQERLAEERSALEEERSAQQELEPESETEDPSEEGDFGEPLVFDLEEEQLQNFERIETEAASQGDPFAGLDVDPVAPVPDEPPFVPVDIDVDGGDGGIELPVSESTDVFDDLAPDGFTDIAVGDNTSLQRPFPETATFELPQEDLFDLSPDTDESPTETTATVTGLFDDKGEGWNTDFDSVATAEAIEGDLDDLNALDSTFGGFEEDGIDALSSDESDDLSNVVPLDSIREKNGVSLELDGGEAVDPEPADDGLA